MEEIWKDIEGYEGLYKVSNLGNVYSYYINRNLKYGISDGYKFVILNKNGDRKFKLIHRLVAEAFIPNPNNLPIINHKNENRLDCHVDNLEWCDYIYNATYNDAHVKRGEVLSVPVFGYNNKGELIYEYYGVREASRALGISNARIVACCNNQVPIYKNIAWSYKKLTIEESLNRFIESKKRHNNSTKKKRDRLSKKVNQYDLDGNFICSYPSAREAGRKLGFSPSLIASVCRGEHKQTHGYKFKYA